MKNICGLFANRETGEQAMIKLLESGLPQTQISLIMSGETRDKLLIVGHDEAGAASKGATIGATLLGAFSAILAGGIAVGSLAIPGSTLFVAGPLVAALSGGAVGAVAGGLIGALVNAGIPEADAKLYEGEIRRGMALLVVHPETDQQDTLARITIANLGTITQAA
jgi:hypothetical protein